MAKDMKMSLLLGYYGSLLSEKTRSVVESYYYDDLSLSEIASDTGMTRQGVMDHIRRAEAALVNYEEKLGFAQKLTAAARCAEKIKGISTDERVTTLCNEIISQTDN